MPTVLLVKGYRFFFFSNERSEPLHIHIEKAECYAKFWSDPLYIAINYGSNSKELSEIGNGIGIRWKSIDEDISVSALL